MQAAPNVESISISEGACFRLDFPYTISEFTFNISYLSTSYNRYDSYEMLSEYVFVCENVCECPSIPIVCLFYATLVLTFGHLFLTRLNCIPNEYFVVIVAPQQLWQLFWMDSVLVSWVNN